MIDKLIYRAWLAREINTRCKNILESARRKYSVVDLAGLKSLNDLHWYKLNGSGKRSVALIKEWLAKQCDDVEEALPCHNDFFQAVIENHNSNQAKWGGDAHDDTHDFADWILFVEARLLKMKSKHYTGEGNASEMFVSLAAVCLAGFNSMRRKSKR